MTLTVGFLHEMFRQWGERIDIPLKEYLLTFFKRNLFLMYGANKIYLNKSKNSLIITNMVLLTSIYLLLWNVNCKCKFYPSLSEL